MKWFLQNEARAMLGLLLIGYVVIAAVELGMVLFG